VPAGSAAAPICDTWALIDYLVESAPDDGLFRKAIDQACTRYVPGLVLAEVDYFLRDERKAMQVFMQDLAHGAFTYAPPTIGQVSHSSTGDARCASLRRRSTPRRPAVRVSRATDRPRQVPTTAGSTRCPRASLALVVSTTESSDR